MAFSMALMDFSLPMSKCSTMSGKIAMPLSGITGRISSSPGCLRSIMLLSYAINCSFFLLILCHAAKWTKKAV